MTKTPDAEGRVQTERPDRYCLTREDGECVSTDPRCMHQPPLRDWRYHLFGRFPLGPVTPSVWQRPKAGRFWRYLGSVKPVTTPARVPTDNGSRSPGDSG